VPTLTEVVHVSPPPDLLIEPTAEGDEPPTIVALTATPMPLDLDLSQLDSVAGPPVMMPDGSLALSSPTRVTADAAPAVPAPPPYDPAVPAITERVLVDVQRRVDLMLEYRLRESLTPALARMTDNFIRDTRNELAVTLREIVARAVEAELSRERTERAERAARRED
jgi:hypothetical protein